MNLSKLMETVTALSRSGRREGDALALPTAFVVGLPASTRTTRSTEKETHGYGLEEISTQALGKDKTRALECDLTRIRRKTRSSKP
jgi:hypothetical protein